MQQNRGIAEISFDGPPARLGVGPSYVDIVSNSVQVTVN